LLCESGCDSVHGGIWSVKDDWDLFLVLLPCRLVLVVSGQVTTLWKSLFRAKTCLSKWTVAMQLITMHLEHVFQMQTRSGTDVHVPI
jgi:hypothetical protein